MNEITRPEKAMSVLHRIIDFLDDESDYFGQCVAERIWERLVDADGQHFESFGSFAVHDRPQGLGVRNREVADFVRHILISSGHVGRWIDLLEVIAKPRGAPRKNDTIGANIRFYSLSRSPQGFDRTLLRLKREAPVLYEGVLQGRYSAHSAAVVAGFRRLSKARTAFDTVIDAVAGLSPEEKRRVTFCILESLDAGSAAALRQELNA